MSGREPTTHARDLIGNLGSQKQRKWDPRARTNRLGEQAVRARSARRLNCVIPGATSFLLLSWFFHSPFGSGNSEIYLWIQGTAEPIGTTRNRRHNETTTLSFPLLPGPCSSIKMSLGGNKWSRRGYWDPWPDFAFRTPEPDSPSHWASHSSSAQWRNNTCSACLLSCEKHIRKWMQ